LRGHALIIDIFGYRSQGEEKAETLKFGRLKARISLRLKTDA
jgi:hypothetical protein